MPFWLILLVIGLLTFGLRAAFPVLGRRWTLPPSPDRALRLVSPAVLSALVATSLFLPSGPKLGLQLSNRLLAAAVALCFGLLVLRTVKQPGLKLIPLLIGVGLVSLWLLQLIR
jgi:branched-subunit amino acid transport protein